MRRVDEGYKAVPTLPPARGVYRVRVPLPHEEAREHLDLDAIERAFRCADDEPRWLRSLSLPPMEHEPTPAYVERYKHLAPLPPEKGAEPPPPKVKPPRPPPGKRAAGRLRKSRAQRLQFARELLVPAWQRAGTPPATLRGFIETKLPDLAAQLIKELGL